MADTSRLVVIAPWYIEPMRQNDHSVIGSDIESIEATDTILLYLSATAEAIQTSITLLALLKRKQQQILLVSDKSNQNLITPVLRSLQSQLLNYFPTTTPQKKVREIIGIYLQSGLFDLV